MDISELNLSCLIQRFIHKKKISEDKLQKLINSMLMNNMKVKTSCNEIIELINHEIDSSSLKIKQFLRETDGEKYYILINCRDDSLSSTYTSLSPNLMSIFMILLKEFIENYSGILTVAETINLIVSTKKCTTAFAEKCIDSLKENKLLSIVNMKDISLSEIAIAELTPVILDKFSNNNLKCMICSSLTIQCKTCSNCHSRIHLYCLANLIKKRQSLTCTICDHSLTI